MNLEFLDLVKRRTLVALSSSTQLRESLVLKGGNLLDIVFSVSARASTDLDFSIEGDLDAQQIRAEVESHLIDTFLPEGYHVIDVKISERPPEISDKLKEFWGGLRIEFKLVTKLIYAKHENDLEQLRRNATPIGHAGSTIFKIDISKFEYCDGKQPFYIDGTQLFGYSPEMVVAEKLRAICQQMPEYRAIVKKHLAGRARDFVDIQMMIQEFRINLANPGFHTIVRKVFEAKRVPLHLLGRIGEYSEDHRADFVAVRDTVRPGVELNDFDFYVNMTIRECRQLEPLWNV